MSTNRLLCKRQTTCQPIPVTYTYNICNIKTLTLHFVPVTSLQQNTQRLTVMSGWQRCLYHITHFDGTCMEMQGYGLLHSDQFGKRWKLWKRLSIRNQYTLYTHTHVHVPCVCVYMCVCVCPVFLETEQNKHVLISHP